MRGKMTLGLLLPLAAGLIAGCQQPSATGDLDELVDENDNGFVDIAPPEGVDFNEETNAKVELINTIGSEELGGLAQTQGIDPGLIALVAIEADLVMTLYYEGFETLVVRQSQSLEPFTRSLEAACPDSIDVDLTVVANVPLVGPQEVFSQLFVLTQARDYNCGETLRVETFVDNNGNPQVSVSANGRRVPLN